MISDSLLSCSYVLTLITDGMRSVRAFHFDKAAASVLTTCVSSSYHQEQLLSIVTGSVYVKGGRACYTVYPYRNLKSEMLPFRESSSWFVNLKKSKRSEASKHLSHLRKRGQIIIIAIIIHSSSMTICYLLLSIIRFMELLWHFGHDG